ncbi:MAG: hypothetical protein ACE5QV_07855 [Fidelibacterota bacterium]
MIKNLKNIFKLRWIIASAAGYLLVLVIYNFFILDPIVREYKSLQKRKAGIEDSYVFLNSIKIENLLKISRNNLKISENRLKGIFTNSKRKVGSEEIIGQVNRYVEQSRLTLININQLPAQSTEIDGVSRERFRMEVRGSYYRFMWFMSEYLKQNPLFLIEELNIEKAPKGEELNWFSVFSNMKKVFLYRI